MKPLILLVLQCFLSLQNLPTKLKMGKNPLKISPIHNPIPHYRRSFCSGETSMRTGFDGILKTFSNLPSNIFYRHYFAIAPFKKMWNTENVEQTFRKIRKYGLCGCSNFVPFFEKTRNKKWNTPFYSVVIPPSRKTKQSPKRECLGDCGVLI